MPESPVDTVMSLIPQLTDSERKRASSLIKALTSLEPGKRELVEPPRDALEDLLLDAINDVCNKHGLPCGGPVMLRKNSAYPSFKSKVPMLNQYFSSAGLDRTRMRALLGIAIDHLFLSLQFMNVPIGARMLLSNIHRIPEVMDHHYPGYAGMGLLRLLVRKEGT